MSVSGRFISPASALYIGKSTLFKVFLLAGLGAVSALFVWYSLRVIDHLKQDTRAQVEKYVKLWQLAANSPSSGQELQFIFDEIIVKANFPIIVANDQREPIHWRNVPGISPDDSSQAVTGLLRKLIARYRADNREFPIYFGDTHVNYLYYGDPPVVAQLRMMPYVEIGIVLAFLLVGLIGFQSIRRSEERNIWVGMAKEAAHQLGTPISSLLGWLEVMKDKLHDGSDPAELAELVDMTVINMRADVTRLQRVANRFGMIGSIPDLSRCDLNRTIEDTVEYYRRRLPFEGKGIRLEFTPGEVPPVLLNDELFAWAIENLVKNSLHAVDARDGVIALTTHLNENGRQVVVRIKDNGRGIPPGAARKIFRPGFTTKKRGWGMGLTLVKRIVEDYHGGRILLQQSGPGKTVFEIQLPLEKETDTPR